MKKRIIGLALVAGAIAAVAKLVTTQKAEWQGLNEAEARAKVEERLPSRVPDEKRAAVADKVVEKMRERGVLQDEPAETPSDVEVEADEPEAAVEEVEPEAAAEVEPEAEPEVEPEGEPVDEETEKE